MNDVLNYIFKNIDVTEKTLSVLNVAMKKQTRFNKVFLMYAVLSSATFVKQAVISRAQYQIEKLENDIKELKHPEGE
jgi:hypothetical protein